MISATLLDAIYKLLNAHKNKILTYTQIAVSEHQFKPLKSLILDELGKNGFETELAKLLNEGNHSVNTRNGQE
jgi:hypothetical protein